MKKLATKKNSVWLVASRTHLSSKDSLLDGSIILKSAISHLRIREIDVREVVYKRNYLRLVSGIIHFPLIFIRDLFFSTNNLAQFKFNVHKLEMKFWRKKIFAEKPRLIIGVGLTKSLIMSAREAGITTVEVQHGIINQATINTYWKFQYNGDFYPPNIIFGWNEYFREIVETNGITFEKLDYLEKYNFNNHNSTHYDYLYCLNYNVYGFIRIIKIPRQMRLHLRQNRFKKNMVRLHPLTYGAVSKAITRIILILLGTPIPISRNLSFLEILADAKEVITEPSAAIWEAYFSGKDISVIGNLNRDQFSNDIINYCKFI